MPKCFITGVDIKIEDAYLLDINAAFKAYADLKNRFDAVDRLIQNLGESDEMSIHDSRSGETTKKREKRLVSLSIAIALSEAYPTKDLFISFPQWRSRKARVESDMSQEDPLSSKNADDNDGDRSADLRVVKEGSGNANNT